MCRPYLVAQSSFVFFCLVGSESPWRQISDRNVTASATERAISVSIARIEVLGGCGGGVTCI